MSKPKELAKRVEQDIEKFQPEHTLDYYVKARGKKKRPYIYRYKKAISCDHPELRIVARGGNIYHCPACNYTFQWPGAIVYPQHFNVIMAAFHILNFSKEYGSEAVMEVLRRPIGQTDGTPHKPVLPEGKSFMETMELLNEIDIRNGSDPTALDALKDEFWVSSATRKGYLKQHFPEKELESGNGDQPFAPAEPVVPAVQAPRDAGSPKRAKRRPKQGS